MFLLEVAMVTRVSQFRLSPEELARLDDIRRAYGLSTLTAAVRVAVEKTWLRLDPGGRGLPGARREKGGPAPGPVR